jgi:hypothetical protein
MNPYSSNSPNRFVKQHCCFCDKIIGWHTLPINGVVLCEKCFDKRYVDVCFHCNITHNHNMTKINNETYDITHFFEQTESEDNNDDNDDNDGQQKI